MGADRTEQRVRGRKAADRSQPFARVPLDVLTCDAFATMPHAAIRVLLALVGGVPEQRNGLMQCSQGYAVRFGLSSHDTVVRSLAELEERGLVAITQRVAQMRKVPTHYAVSWWPTYFRNGKVLDKPEPPTHAYLNWTPTVPAKAPKRKPQAGPRKRPAKPNGKHVTTLPIATAAMSANRWVGTLGACQP